jgi:LCP family protein required for cell wall assembly
MKYVNVRQRNMHARGASEKRQGRAKLISVILILFVTGGLLFAFRDKIKSVFDPVSLVTNVAAADLEQTDGRTNILVLGSDKRVVGDVTSELTDTILVASIGRLDNDVVLISIPRDLWVEWPSTGGFSKINAVYAGVDIAGTQYGGIDELKEILEDVLGVPIHYHALITFELFRETIDTLGGVEVTVDNSFTDNYYPVEGKETAPLNERYETISFEAGSQVMDGDTALKFVRSRKGNNGEGTDFARSKRQQKIISAIKDKALSIQTLVNPIKLKELYDVYHNNVDTDIDLATVQNFYTLTQQIEYDKVVSIVLDDRSMADEGGLLYAPEDTSLYGGQYVLLPRTGDFSQIHAYVQKYIFGDKD